MRGAGGIEQGYRDVKWGSHGDEMPAAAEKSDVAQQQQ